MDDGQKCLFLNILHIFNLMVCWTFAVSATSIFVQQKVQQRISIKKKAVKKSQTTQCPEEIWDLVNAQ